MKKIIFTLLILAPILLHAQNFTNICSSGPAFYKKMSTNTLKAYKWPAIPCRGVAIPSSILSGSSVIRLRSAKTPPRDPFSKENLQAKYYVHVLFLQQNNDTIYINAKAQVNDVWRFTKLTTAPIWRQRRLQSPRIAWWGFLMMWWESNSRQEEMTGWQFQAHGMANILNSADIYGLARTFDMTNVPFDTTNYTIVGKLKPVIGIQDFWLERGLQLQYWRYTQLLGIYQLLLQEAPAQPGKRSRTVFCKKTHLWHQWLGYL